MAEQFQPMNINFGLLPPPPPAAGRKKLRGRDRKQAYTQRALADLDHWLQDNRVAAA